MLSLSLVMVLLAIIFFIMAAVGVKGNINWIAIGLAVWAASQIVGAFKA